MAAEFTHDTATIVLILLIILEELVSLREEQMANTRNNECTIHYDLHVAHLKAESGRGMPPATATPETYVL